MVKHIQKNSLEESTFFQPHTRRIIDMHTPTHAHLCTIVLPIFMVPKSLLVDTCVRMLD
ncbi:hypothetical protein M5D96_012402, partial [Drosophila gunungcola]